MQYDFDRPSAPRADMCRGEDRPADPRSLTPLDLAKAQQYEAREPSVAQHLAFGLGIVLYPSLVLWAVYWLMGVIS